MCAEQYLSNFENSKPLLNLAPQVLKDLKTLYTQLHEDWIRDVQVISMIFFYQLHVFMNQYLKRKNMELL